MLKFCRKFSRNSVILVLAVLTVLLLFNFYAFSDDNDYLELQNILTNDNEILGNEKFTKIFFIESHTNRERTLDKPRQACSVESAARTNPDMEIFFVFATNSGGVNIQYSDLTEALLTYPNVHFRFLNPVQFSKSTILEKFFSENRLKDSLYPLEHMSDILRVLLLNKYGGQYLDLDVLSLLPLSSVNQTNFACPEDDNVVTNAILNLDLDKGFEVSSLYAKYLVKNYNPVEFGENGPTMLTTVIRTFCLNVSLTTDKYTKCGDHFTTLPREKCYPVNYDEWQMFYREKDRNEVFEKIENSGAYFLHIWNKMQYFDNKIYELTTSSKAAYVELARDFCPRVFKTLKDFF